MRLALVLITLILLCGCGAEPEPAAPAADATAADPPDSSIATAESERIEARRSDEYELRIEAAEIDPGHQPLLRAVSLYSAQVRDEFLGQVEAAKAEGFEFDLPWQLELKLSRVVNGERVVAVQASGFVFQGGAHGLPLEASFVYLVDRKQMMAIDDWFADDAVWEAISARAVSLLQSQLAPMAGEHDGDSEENLEAQSRDWLLEGAGPDPQNFHLYLPQLGQDQKIEALQISFAPYQVAPYAAGSPEVSIGADLLIDHLKPEFRDYYTD